MLLKTVLGFSRAFFLENQVTSTRTGCRIIVGGLIIIWPDVPPVALYCYMLPLGD